MRLRRGGLRKMNRFSWDNKKSWRNATISLFIMIVILLGYSIYNYTKDPGVLPKNLCGKIKGVPAWVQYGEVIGYGVIDNSVPGFPEELEEVEIYLLYSGSCPACQLQIKNFGEYWEEYQSLGYAINCENES